MNPPWLLLQAVCGFVLLHGIAWLLCERRHDLRWRPVLGGCLLSLLLGALLLNAPALQQGFWLLNGLLDALESATRDGTSFVFGFLGGGSLPYAETNPAASFVLAFRALPLVLVVSALSALLMHWGVLPWLVRAMSLLLRKSMGVGGAVGLASAANVFVGMVEAPLVVQAWIGRMNRGELFVLMSCGMATIAGTVMGLYAAVLSRAVPDALGHILIASIIATPAAMAVSLLMVPEDGPSTEAGVEPTDKAVPGSSMEALMRGTVDGAALLVNIIAMLVVLVALVSLLNQLLACLPAVGSAPLSLQRMLGWLMAPVVWLAGIPWHEAVTAGALMGTKTVLNELLAYLDLARLPAEELSARSRLIMTYALCGFANFGSLGIMLGGLCTMAPTRRAEIVQLGFRSLISGTLATLIAASIVAMWR
jgi:CNT family concentrative nucleoside transporter